MAKDWISTVEEGMMKEVREISWFDMSTDDCIGILETKFEVGFAYQGNPGDEFYSYPTEKCFCPKCGEEAIYWEGQINETWDGRAIYAWNYTCFACAIDTMQYEI